MNKNQNSEYSIKFLIEETMLENGAKRRRKKPGSRENKKHIDYYDIFCDEPYRYYYVGSDGEQIVLYYSLGNIDYIDKVGLIFNQIDNPKYIKEKTADFYRSYILPVEMEKINKFFIDLPYPDFFEYQPLDFSYIQNTQQKKKTFNMKSFDFSDYFDIDTSNKILFEGTYNQLIDLLETNQSNIDSFVAKNDYKKSLDYAKRNYDLCKATGYFPYLFFSTFDLFRVYTRFGFHRNALSYLLLLKEDVSYDDPKYFDIRKELDLLTIDAMIECDQLFEAKKECAIFLKWLIINDLDGEKETFECILRQIKINILSDDYSKAYEMTVKHLKLLEKLFGTDNDLTLSFLSVLGELFFFNEMNEEAFDIQLFLFNYYWKKGNNHTSRMLNELNFLAEVVFQRGGTSDAVLLKKYMVDVARKQYGEYSEIFLYYYKQLADIYLRDDKWGASFNMYDRLLDFYEKNNLENNVAIAYVKLGISDAKRASASAALSFVDDYGPNYVEGNQYNFNECLQLDEEVLEIFQREFGEDSNETISVENRIVYDYAPYDPKTALVLQESVVNKTMRIYGNTSSRYIVEKSRIADIYSYMEEHDKALEINIDLYELCKTVYGENYFLTISMADDLLLSLSLCSYKDKTHTEDTIEWAKYLYELKKSIFGDNSKITMDSLEKYEYYKQEFTSKKN